jgi:hypothetical protein
MSERVNGRMSRIECTRLDSKGMNEQKDKEKAAPRNSPFACGAMGGEGERGTEQGEGKCAEAHGAQHSVQRWRGTTKLKRRRANERRHRYSEEHSTAHAQHKSKRRTHSPSAAWSAAFSVAVSKWPL